MSVKPLIQLTEGVVTDVNNILGKNYSAAEYRRRIAQCFSAIDFEDSTCQECLAKRACVVYTAYRGCEQHEGDPDTVLSTEDAEFIRKAIGETPEGDDQGPIPDEVVNIFRASYLGNSVAEVEEIEKEIFETLDVPDFTRGKEVPPPPSLMLTEAEEQPSEAISVPTCSTPEETEEDSGLFVFREPDPDIPNGWNLLDRDYLTDLAEGMGCPPESLIRKHSKTIVKMILERAEEHGDLEVFEERMTESQTAPLEPALRDNRSPTQITDADIIESTSRTFRETTYTGPAEGLAEYLRTLGKKHVKLTLLTEDEET